MEHIRASGHLKHAIDRIPFLEYEIWVMELIDKLNLEKLVSFPLNGKRAPKEAYHGKNKN